MTAAVDQPVAQQFTLPEPAAKASLALAGGPPLPPVHPGATGFAGDGGQVHVDEPAVLTVGRLNWPLILGGGARGGQAGGVHGGGGDELPVEHRRNGQVMALPLVVGERGFPRACGAFGGCRLPAPGRAVD